MKGRSLPVPPHFSLEKVADVWPVDYAKTARAATGWAIRHLLQPAASDRTRTGMLLVDVQNTFCIPGFDLFVAARSGRGAVDDNTRLCQFIYRNLGHISTMIASLDTHLPIQIFHPVFLTDQQGQHPAPYTLISREDIETGRWRINPKVCRELRIDPGAGREHLLYYTSQLGLGGKHAWTVWPYHALQGGVGHALVSSVEEAIFFHSIARTAQPRFVTKGSNPLTESYSVLGPEVRTDSLEPTLEARNQELIETLAGLDVLIVAGQAKSHCLAWTVQDLLDSSVVEATRVYLLEDCTSPVVVPGLVDYTEPAEAFFHDFEERGVNLVRSPDPVESWPAFRS